ncbi:hypothetical protein Patl1_32154 [Pistacia atlantica]|uniref:Uncharacterized protein n=1 Tax=Pistacia atlantica TaxID=434234 RepID=A0ACC1AMF6_9ROSI|nr:hypothetical protein Patl1_32154 [Pistacia atlantica]
MQIGSQLSSESEVHLDPENTPTQDAGLVVASSTLNNAMLQQSAKRQWAAWTRQEEESFFTALRQNFEKITHKVQSKNKDQVICYEISLLSGIITYRLVRRMNKLLGPGLCLDAKNSKDTNAAMLRWWSLLEKYSCKASKLHLKPRRFKIFVEALEHQLLKDRKRSVKKRSSQGENCSPTASSTVSNQNRPSGQDTCTVKLVLVDSQNIQKLGPAKGSLKRNVNIGVNRTNKGEMTTMKPARQRRKPATDKEVELDQEQNALEPVDKAPLPLPAISQNLFAENSAHAPVKLKLQLYPIDDGTRRALEMDNHNPHLELTLSTRKKISSVVEHLNRKWGNSSVASGQLMLFPYSVQRENLVGHQRWTQDSLVSAADVYAIIGSPPLFRLRFLSHFHELIFLNLCKLHQHLAIFLLCIPDNVKSGKDQAEQSTSDQPEKLVDSYNDTSVKENHAIASSLSNMPHEITKSISTPKSNFMESDPAAKVSWHKKEPDSKSVTRQLEDVGDMKLSNGTALSAGEWADSLTNISVGDLLSDVLHGIDASPVAETSQCLQQIPFSCDSFDAAIAAHISKHQNKMEHELKDDKEAADDLTGEDPMDEKPTDLHSLENSEKDFSGLTDIYWPDSLGPLDLDIQSSKYRCEDIIIGDSLGGLSRLIASSLDAFQNCSFFGLDKKEPTTVETRETASLSDFKIGSQG